MQWWTGGSSESNGALSKGKGKRQPAGKGFKGSAKGSKGSFKGHCYNCNEEGHAAKDCPTYNPRRDGPGKGKDNTAQEPEHAWSMIVDDVQQQHARHLASRLCKWINKHVDPCDHCKPSGPRHFVRTEEDDPTPAEAMAENKQRPKQNQPSPA